MTATTESRPKSTSKKSDKKSKAQVGRLQGSSFVAELEQHAPWETWAEKLANRKRPVTLKKLVGRSCRPLEWSIKVNTESETVDLLRLLDSLKRRPQKGEPADWPAVVSDWLETAKQRAPSQAFAHQGGSAAYRPATQPLCPGCRLGLGVENNQNGVRLSQLDVFSRLTISQRRC